MSKMATWVGQSPGEGSVTFDCEFVKKPPVIQSECPVCLQILCEPYQISCCGYSFCRVCIERIKTDKKSCPTCNEESFSAFHNKGLQRSLYGFQVYCSHKQEGCEWKGELGQLDNHLNLSPQPDKQLEGCKYSGIKCIYCSELIKRSRVTFHQTEHCDKRPFSCEYCHSYESTYEDVINNHWPVCGYHPVQCPNKCGTFPQRQALENHVTKDCPKAVIDCDFHHVGCNVKVPRKDMPAHLNENLVTHMSLQAASYNKLLASHKELQASHDTLQSLTVSHSNLLARQSGLLTSLQEKGNKLESENETLKADHVSLQTSHDKLQSLHHELQDEVKELKIENRSFKHQLLRLQVSSQTEKAKHSTTSTPMSGPHESALQQHKSLQVAQISRMSTHSQPSSKIQITRHSTGKVSDGDSVKQFVHHRQSSEAALADLPRCQANGCINPIYHDVRIPQEVGSFKYCSPECRDRHMPPVLQDQLEQDIQSLQETATAISVEITPTTDYHPRRSYSQAVPHDGPSAVAAPPKSKRKPKEEKIQPHPNKKSKFDSDTSSSKSKTSKESEEKPKPGCNSKAENKSSSKSEVSKKSGKAEDTKKGQKTIKIVIIRKDKQENVGIIVSDKIFTSDEVTGFMITGVAVDSSAYKLLQDDKLRLLDIIKTVNGQPLVPGDRLSVQEKFNNMVCSSAAVVALDIHRTIALPPLVKRLKEASRTGSPITHVIAMRPPQFHGKEEFGMSLNDRVMEAHVSDCKVGFPAHSAGLRDDDSIRALCVAASQTDFKALVTVVTKTKDAPHYKYELATTLQQAAKEEKDVVLFVVRSTVAITHNLFN